MRKLILVCLLFLSIRAHAQEFLLSDSAKIVIVTCGPYQGELYSAFGHSAIRVSDPAYGIDVIFNYGVFDFDQPNFYLNFARGQSYYILAVQHYSDFKYAYIYYNRFLHEQELDLSTEEKQKIYDFLKWNARPENRSYHYEYFYDNCATRIRDLFEKALPGKVEFDDSYITANLTIRDLTDLYLEQQPWGDLGIDICLGLPMDKTASPFEYMFLPDYIEAGFDHATIDGRPLVAGKTITYEATPETTKKNFFHPWMAFGFFAFVAIALTLLDWRRKKLSRWFDVILFFTTGLTGLLLLFLWFLTDHKAAAYNFNLIWALPTNLVAAVFLLKKKIPLWLGNYFMVTTILWNGLLLSWFFLPQQLNVFLVPLVIAMVARSIWIFLYSYEIRVTGG
jgi:hypothetical protein